MSTPKVKAKAPNAARTVVPACPACGSHSVYWREGPKTMRCKRCGKTFGLPGKKPGGKK